MRKLRLNPEELTVEAFRTTRAEAGVGTVRGNDAAALSTFDPWSISGWDNCICPLQVGTDRATCSC